jgi:hypothetical protein
MQVNKKLQPYKTLSNRVAKRLPLDQPILILPTLTVANVKRVIVKRNTANAFKLVFYVIQNVNVLTARTPSRN